MGWDGVSLFVINISHLDMSDQLMQAFGDLRFVRENDRFAQNGGGRHRRF